MKVVMILVVIMLSVSFASAHGFGGGKASVSGLHMFRNNDRFSLRTFDSWGVRTSSFAGALNYEFRNNERFAPRTFDSWGRRSVKFAGAVNRNNPYILW